MASDMQGQISFHAFLDSPLGFWLKSICTDFSMHYTSTDALNIIARKPQMSINYYYYYYWYYSSLSLLSLDCTIVQWLAWYWLTEMVLPLSFISVIVIIDLGQANIKINQTVSPINSFIQAISIASLQVHYYSKALPAQHGYCGSVFHAETP